MKPRNFKGFHEIQQEFTQSNRISSDFIKFTTDFTAYFTMDIICGFHYRFHYRFHCSFDYGFSFKFHPKSTRFHYWFHQISTTKSIINVWNHYLKEMVIKFSNNQDIILLTLLINGMCFSRYLIWCCLYWTHFVLILFLLLKYMIKI